MHVFLPEPELERDVLVREVGCRDDDEAKGATLGGGSGFLESGSADDSPPPAPSTPPPSPPPLSDVISQSIAIALSDAVDCHGPPVRIELLPGAPLSVHAVDRTGTRTTSIHGADLRTFLLFEDGSRTATGLPHQSTAGVWRFGFDDDPLGLALTAGVTEVHLVANLTEYLDFTTSLANATCCTLAVPRFNRPGESIAALFPPPLAVARVMARNTGLQGGYGVGDSIEITFNRRTDRAGVEVAQHLTRRWIDELLVLDGASDGALGVDPQAYGGVWRDDCTLMLVAGNTTGATAPVTGVFRVRVRDDVHELRDYRRFLRVGSVARSPTMEGTFGAATGMEGRLDPLRQMLPDLAVRRYIPPTHVTIPSLRIGPMTWHPMNEYDVDRDRTSECDVNYMRVRGAASDGHNGEVPPGVIPPYQLDERTRALVEQTVVEMSRPLPSGLPFTQPPHGLPTDPTHDHEEGDAPSPPPWSPVDAWRQIDERAAAAAIGPNGQVQRYPLTLDAPEDRQAFGLEHETAETRTRHVDNRRSRGSSWPL